MTVQTTPQHKLHRILKYIATEKASDRIESYKEKDTKETTIEVLAEKAEEYVTLVTCVILPVIGSMG